MAPSDIEARTQELGRALLEAADGYRPGAAERVQDWLLTHAVANDRFRDRLLRYMDVLASLDYDSSGREAKRLAREYFGETFPELPFALRWLLRLARNEHLPARLVGASARRSAELFARRFITPPGPETVRATLALLSEQGRYPSFDLLGEAVLSDREAEDHVERYCELVARLAEEPGAGGRTPGGIAALQISLKLSSLTAHFSPLDADGTIERVLPSLQRIAETARGAGVGLTVDMEQYEFRDLTWELFRRAFGPGTPFAGWPDAGIVLQAYLHESERHAHAMVEFARERQTPFQVRLVKGAYWDYETIVADVAGWQPPVFTEKRATDAQFERVLELLVAAYPQLRLAIGSHNARGHARAEALAEAAGLPAGAIEHQTLFRTAEGTSRALTALGWVARDYIPVGELLPGMAYLVRRVLENSSQAGFLLQNRAGVSAEQLLLPPPAGPPAAPRRSTHSHPFRRSPEARWFDAEFRASFDAALADTRERWGEHFPLRAGSESLPAAEARQIRSPSHPADEPVGIAEFGAVEAVERAVAVTGAAASQWARTSVTRRSEILRRAADLLEDRVHEFAAWVVHEGGRDRADAFAEVEEAVDFLRYYAVQAEDLFARAGDRLASRGVVAVIPPWNFSLSIPCGMTAAALVCGNAVILKPAEQTPLIAARLVALLHEAGVPDAALVCLPGRGEDAGRALVEHPDVGMVAFTGSRAVGSWMHQAVADVRPSTGDVKALVAELGGKNPIIVFADADLDEAVAGITRSAFGHANQKCSAASRVLIQRPIFEQLRDRLVEAARSLRLGRADEPRTQINPIIDEDALQRLRGAAAIARAECEVLLDAFDQPQEWIAAGPLIVQLPADATTSAQTASEELFGPILILVLFDDEREAFRIANETPFGLTAGVFSRSPQTIGRAIEAIRAGNIYVNRHTTGARVGIEPFGGMRMSGSGPKAGGTDYLWAFTRRSDVPTDDPAVLEALGDRPRASAAVSPVVVLPELWDAPLGDRVEAVERAAVLLGEGGDHRLADALLAAAQAARRELSPQPTIPIVGQHTELRHDSPRGIGLIHAAGGEAAWWLAAPLLAGNGVATFASPGLDALRDALYAAGIPRSSLTDGGDLPALLGACALAAVAFAATDGGAALARALHERLGPTVDGQSGLKALLSRLDGPQAGEPGFLRRFAQPTLVAVRTLRHGADLALEVSTS